MSFLVYPQRPTTTSLLSLSLSLSLSQSVSRWRAPTRLPQRRRRSWIWTNSWAPIIWHTTHCEDKTERQNEWTNGREETNNWNSTTGCLFKKKKTIAAHSLFRCHKGTPAAGDELGEKERAEHLQRKEYSFTVLFLLAAAAAAEVRVCVCLCEWCNVSSESISYSLLLLDEKMRREAGRQGGMMKMETKYKTQTVVWCAAEPSR